MTSVKKRKGRLIIREEERVTGWGCEKKKLLDIEREHAHTHMQRIATGNRTSRKRRMLGKSWINSVVDHNPSIIPRHCQYHPHYSSAPLGQTPCATLFDLMISMRLIGGQVLKHRAAQSGQVHLAFRWKVRWNINLNALIHGLKESDWASREWQIQYERTSKHEWKRTFKFLELPLWTRYFISTVPLFLTVCSGGGN